jgi:protein-disulfide isomerase
MKALIGTGALAAALLLAGCGDSGSGGNASGNNTASAAPVAPPANGDWSQTVVETPEGGFRMGNPNAQVKLVEYASLTCPHCAEFSEEASGPLGNMVKTGQVSWEFRHFMLFPTDPGMSLLSRCQGPGPFFALTEQIYADQRNWSSKVQALPEAEIQRLQSLPPEQQVTAIVKSAGLDQFFRQRGIPQAKIDQCLGDQQGLQKLAALTNLGSQEGVTGTPSFFINGKIVELANTAIWPQLEPKLREALGQ